MVLTLWKHRSRFVESPDLELEYAGIPSMCTFKIHHKGIFTQNHGRRYVDGLIDYYDFVDMELFSVLEIDEMLKEIGYDGREPVYYHFRIPGTDLDYGLLPLANDSDVLVLTRYVINNKLIDVYIEHGYTRVNTYQMTPTKVLIEENEEPGSPELNMKRIKRNKTTGSCSRMLDLDFDSRNLAMVPFEPQSQPKESVNVSHENVDNAGAGTSQIDVDLIEDFDPFDGLDFDDISIPTQEPTVDAELSTHENQLAGQPSKSVGQSSTFVGQSSTFVGQSSKSVGQSSKSMGQSSTFVGQCTGSSSSEDYGSSEGEDSASDCMFEHENILIEPEVDMRKFRSVVDQDMELVDRDPHTIPIPDTLDNDDDPLGVIDTQAFETTVDSSEQRERMLKNLRKPIVCSEGEVHLPTFRVGQKFKSKSDVKELVSLHSIHTKRALYFEKNDKLRIRVRCKGVVPDLTACGPWTKSKIRGRDKVINTTTTVCPWVVFVSRSNVEEDWIVKTVVKDHNCVQSRKIHACTAKFMAKNLVGQLESNPKIPINALHEDLQKKYEVGFSRMKAFRAKQIAQKYVNGDFQKQYSLLRDYGLELQKCNVGTTFKIDVESEPTPSSQTRTFRRVYVCLGSLKLGYKAGMREFLGLDGAFVKGPYPGQVLSAVGLDSNNGIYPLAYAIVEAENISSWTWFLECLGDDLDLNASSNYTFASDRQKGLIQAVSKVFPNAEHRFCLRHIWDNMRLQWRDKEFKDLLWQCASATTISHHDNAMTALKEYDVKAFEWLSNIAKVHWTRAHFSGRARTDALTNNLCEVFNSKIIDARDKPIITCLEYIREYLMKRIVVVQKEIDKQKGPLTPTVTHILDGIKKQATQNTCIFNGRDKTQVTTPSKDQYVVNLQAKTCTCGYWELTGIVCSHVVSAIWDTVNHGGKNVPNIEEWVHPVYWLSTWQCMYSYKVDPINGRSMWPKSACPTSLLPPTHHTQVGRPKKKRKRAVGEVVTSGRNLSRKFLTVTCSKCGNKGHNQRSCKGQGGDAGVSQVQKKQTNKAGSKQVGSKKGQGGDAEVSQVQKKKTNKAGSKQVGSKKGQGGNAEVSQVQKKKTNKAGSKQVGSKKGGSKEVGSKEGGSKQGGGKKVGSKQGGGKKVGSK